MRSLFIKGVIFKLSKHLLTKTLQMELFYGNFSYYYKSCNVTNLDFSYIFFLQSKNW